MVTWYERSKRIKELSPASDFQSSIQIENTSFMSNFSRLTICVFENLLNRSNIGGGEHLSDKTRDRTWQGISCSQLFPTTNKNSEKKTSSKIITSFLRWTPACLNFSHLNSEQDRYGRVCLLSELFSSELWRRQVSRSYGRVFLLQGDHHLKLPFHCGGKTQNAELEKKEHLDTF